MQLLLLVRGRGGENGGVELGGDDVRDGDDDDEVEVGGVVDAGGSDEVGMWWVVGEHVLDVQEHVHDDVAKD